MAGVDLCTFTSDALKTPLLKFRDDVPFLFDHSKQAVNSLEGMIEVSSESNSVFLRCSLRETMNFIFKGDKYSKNSSDKGSLSLIVNRESSAVRKVLTFKVNGRRKIGRQGKI